MGIAGITVSNLSRKVDSAMLHDIRTTNLEVASNYLQ